ncbi:vitelline membrane outer layer protein 1-like [Anolis carolinensis]|uniref:vitelline membrane outer layer protein 1-like n=1 Tax=Anolis carolinensis TaxID=28377 RepID=UPI002F2B497D
MDLSKIIVICLVFCCVWDTESRKTNTLLKVPNGARWGDWGEIQICTSGHAKGFAIKVQEPQGMGDDSSLNAIRLYCESGETIESTAGVKGEWSNSINCSKGFLNSFSLNVEKSQGPLDDSAANNIKFKCQDGEELKGNSYEWGTFGPWSKPCETGAICGIQTRVEPANRGFFTDDTGLNDVQFYCCD